MKNHTTPCKTWTSASGRAYHVYLLPGRRNLALLAKLARAAAPGMAELSAGGGDVMKKDVGVLGRAIAAALDKLSGPDFDHAVGELLWDFEFDNDQGERCAGLPLVLDAHFAGDALGMLSLLKFALEANYGNFFEVFTNAAKKTAASADADSAKKE